MHSEDNAILLHDIRAAMLNHTGLHKEVHDSLTQLTRVLQSLLPGPDAERQGSVSANVDSLKQQINEILVEDVEQCMPMLQLSSDRLSGLLSTMVRDVIQAKTGVGSVTRSE